MQKRIDTYYPDKMTHGVDEGIDQALIAKEKGETVSIRVCCNTVELLRRLVDRNITPDMNWLKKQVRNSD